MIAADVGSLKDEIIEGRTGYAFPAKDAPALAKVIVNYFSSDLFKNLRICRKEIKDLANERYSWSRVAELTTNTYSRFIEN